MRAFVLALLFAAAAPAYAQQADPLAPFAALQGCWRGPFAGQTTVTDEHCFSPMLGGRFVRDTHTVSGAGPYSGETIYWYDPEAQKIAFSYFASDGGTSRGVAEPVANGFEFPTDRYVGSDGQILNLREHWVRQGDTIEVSSEVEEHGVWRPFSRSTWHRATAP